MENEGAGNEKITYEQANEAKRLLIKYLNQEISDFDLMDRDENVEDKILLFALNQSYFKKLEDK